MFSFVIIFPILYCLLKNEKIRKDFFIFYSKNLMKSNYLTLILVVTLFNIIWFFYAPAYRFGIFYNFCIISLLALPSWLNLLQNNFDFVFRYCKIVTCLVLIYFIFVNVNKINWYFERFEIWPPIKNGELISRKNF